MREEFVNLIRKGALYVLTDDRFLPWGDKRKDLDKMREIIRRVKDGGGDIFQYRAKKIPTNIQLSHAEVLREEAEKLKIFFFINDRVDLALITKSDGIHLGNEDIPPEKARELGDFIIGFSTHNIKEVLYANKKPIDYISFGPIFGTQTKENPHPKTGTEILEKVKKVSLFPIVAIGGIKKQNIHKILEMGVKSVAVISYIFSDGVKYIEKRCAELKKEIERFGRIEMK